MANSPESQAPDTRDVTSEQLQANLVLLRLLQLSPYWQEWVWAQRSQAIEIKPAQNSVNRY